MIMVLFEVLPKDEAKETYLAIASDLKASLQHIEGFISVERFQSLSQPNKLLSLSIWEDEKAVLRWKKQIDHQKAQEKGKNELFAGFSIKVAKLVRGYEFSSDVVQD